MVEWNFRTFLSEKDIITGLPRTYCLLNKTYDCAEDKCIFQQILQGVINHG